MRNLVRRTVEETLNALLDEEASELVGAERYERTAGREAYCSGHYARKLVTGAGEVELSVPKLRGATFRTAVIERYRRRETSVEEAIVEMCLAGVSTRRIEDVSELLWGAPVSSGTVSNLNERPFASIEAWRQRPLEGGYPYVFVDGIYLKRSWGGSCENVAVLVAIGVNSAGDREVIGCSEGHAESAEPRREFFSWLRGRGLSGVRLVTGDKCAGMIGALEEVFPGARHQRCTVHFYRNVPGRVPVTRRKAVARMLKAIHAQESREACGRKAEEVAGAWRWHRRGSGRPRGRCATGSPRRLPARSSRLSAGAGSGRTKGSSASTARSGGGRGVVGTFPDGSSALMLVTARLKHIAEREWGRRRYLDMSKLEGMDELKEQAEG